MFPMTNRSIFLGIFGAMLAMIPLLSACNAPGEVPQQAPVEMPAVSLPTNAPVQEPAEASDPNAPVVLVDISGVAQEVTSRVIEAVPASADGPWWEAMPQYTLLILDGYPITDHLLKAQIFVYPVEGLNVNQVASQIPGDLQALLQSRQAGDIIPYLPPYNAGQVMHAQVGYLDFKSGSGVRYLTQFDQAPLPINNNEIHYTFQGLTSDGKYYVSAVLPVSLAGLPADWKVDLDNPPADLVEDFPKYIIDTVDMLNGLPASAFNPDLSVLDAMMGSLEIQ